MERIPHDEQWTCSKLPGAQKCFAKHNNYSKMDGWTCKHIRHGEARASMTCSSVARHDPFSLGRFRQSTGRVVRGAIGFRTRLLGSAQILAEAWPFGTQNWAPNRPRSVPKSIWKATSKQRSPPQIPFFKFKI